MSQYQLFGLGLKGRSAVASAQSRVNVFYEIEKDSEKEQYSIYGGPGLTSFAYLGASPVRGWRVIGNTMYVVWGNTLSKVDNSGVVTSLGNLNTSSGRVDITDNGLQLCIVDGTNGYTYTFATTTFAQIASANFPSGATTCTFMDGYIIVNWPNSGRVGISASYDATTWAALDYRNAESQPDNTSRVISDHSVLHVLGVDTIEFWANTGATDFPFAPISGTAIEVGLAAVWSLARLKQGLIFLGKTRLGGVQVMRLAGYQCEAIADQDFDTIINRYSTVSDATGFSFLHEGHEFYQINFPTMNKSWRYDVSTMLWSEVRYGTSDRHRAEMQVNFLGKPYVADWQDGRIYLLDYSSYSDNGTPMIRELTSRHFFKGLGRIVIDKVEIQFESGVGLVSGQGSDPQAMLQISKDGGRNWGPERWVSMGQIGVTRRRAVWRRWGITRDAVFRLRVSDPVPFVVTMEDIDATPL